MSMSLVTVGWVGVLEGKGFVLVMGTCRWVGMSGGIYQGVKVFGSRYALVMISGGGNHFCQEKAGIAYFPDAVAFSWLYASLQSDPLEGV